MNEAYANSAKEENGFSEDIRQKTLGLFFDENIYDC